jgi:hydroxymethylpyrimidine pyrophosphatase-like HAD family hydrolase
MTTLPAPATPSALLSFDFDGTLHHSGGQPPVPLEFYETIVQLREKQGAIWGINTGRSMAQVVEGLMESKFPFLPDWVVAREREIYFPNSSGGWDPLESWNSSCEKEITELFGRCRTLLAQLRHDIEAQTGARWMEFPGEPAGLVAQTAEEMEWIVSHITPLCAHEPQLGWQRNSIWLRFGHRDYQKGSSLSRVAKHYGLSISQTFAIGDGHNDLEMLDPINARMIACPGNAVPDIQEKVRTSGGYIALAECGDGSVEALRYFFPSLTAAEK